jgi:hypothetical protein
MWGGSNWRTLSQVIGGVGKFQLLLRAVLFHGLFELALRLLHDVVSPLYGGKCN